jgi:ABC-type dipeptide/oligopeptide/nickel transport system permease subunit
LIWGARESLRVGILASVIAVSGGLVFGILSGYLGGWVDSLIQRLVEVLLAFPTILLVLSIVAALGPSLTTVLIAAGISTIPVYVRMVRSTVLSPRRIMCLPAARLGQPTRTSCCITSCPTSSPPQLSTSRLAWAARSWQPPA